MFEFIICRNSIRRNNIHCNRDDYGFIAVKMIGKYKTERIFNNKNTRSTDTELYKLKLAVKNPTILLISSYIDNRTNILHHCLVHDLDFMTTPNRALKGCGCPKCHYERSGKKHRKLNDVYIQELKDKNIPLIPLEGYINANTPILHRNNVCKHEYNITPSNALFNKGCPKCANQCISERSSLPLEKVLQMIKENSPNVEMIGEYINATTKTLFLCKICGKIFETKPTNVCHGSGCKSCKLKTANAVRRITHKQFLEKIAGIKNPDIEIIGEYINSSTKIECLCKICKEIYFALPSEISKGRGHRKCSAIKKGLENRIKHSDFLLRMKEINDNIEFLSEYQGADNKIDCHCKICGHNWSCYPGNLYKGAGCPKCADVRGGIKRRQRQAKKYVSEITKLNISLVEEYIDCYSPIMHQCNYCNCQWKTDPHHMLTRGSQCPVCCGSTGERKIGELLTYYNINYIAQKSFSNLYGINHGLLSYDFYIPNFNILIEFQGLQHEKAIDYFGGEEKFKIQQEHDIRKRNYAEEHNIKLLEIWYYDYSKIEEILIKELNLKSVETVIPA